MSKREEFARQVRAIADTHPAYRIGGSGKDGTCDCVGLCIGALRAMGIPYKGEHSSNWVPRREAVEVWEITSSSDLTIGDAVLKAREPGDPKYDLPSRFQSYKDIRDYYHIGVVTSVNPLEITHMTTPTSTVDTKFGKWEYAMLFRQLQGDESEEKPVMYKAYVRTKHDPLNMRNAPIDGDILAKIPIGYAVDVLEELPDGLWAKIKFDGRVGYASREYLSKIDTVDPDLPDEVEEVPFTTLLDRENGTAIKLIGNWEVARD